MAGETGYRRWTGRIGTCSREARIDFARHRDHSAADLLTWVFVPRKARWPTGVTEPAVYLQGVAEVLHDRSRAVNFGSRRQNLQVGRRVFGGHESFGVVLIEEMVTRFGFRLHRAAVACEAIDVMVKAAGVIAVRRDGEILPGAAHQGDPLARGFLLRLRVAGEVSLDVTVNALHAERFVEFAHNIDDGVGRFQQFEVLRSGARATASRALLRHNGER